MTDVAQSGTLRRWSTFRNGAGALTDPTTPRVDVLNPSAVVVINDAIPTRDSLGTYFYDVIVAADASLGEWEIRWTGVIEGATLESGENFTVVPFGTIGASQSLVSLAKFKLALSEPSTAYDELYIDALQDASQAVQDYIERDFLAPLVTEPRTYNYDGSGVLEIDDASAVADVFLNDATVAYPADLWTPHAIVRGQSYTWLELATSGRTPSPEMGFTRNEDTLLPSRVLAETVTVDGDWGWNDVPRAVQRATIYVAAMFLLDPRGGAAGVSSESVAEVARTYIDAEKLGNDDPIPSRARQLLDPYARN